jgi:hypothetical protein
VNTALRSLFVWLLLLALPLQGVAAARMLPSVSTPAVAAAAHHCHDMPAAQAAKAAGGDHQDKHRGVCPGCCIVVALVSTPLVPPVFAPPSFAIPFRAAWAASVDPALPDRPPRLAA